MIYLIAIIIGAYNHSWPVFGLCMICAGLIHTLLHFRQQNTKAKKSLLYKQNKKS